MMREQFECLDNIVKCIYSEAGCNYLGYIYEYRFNPDEGWEEYGISIINEDSEVILLSRIDYREIVIFSEKLHQLMKKHTGGDWKKFVLIIDEKGKVTTKFEYQDQFLI